MKYFTRDWCEGKLGENEENKIIKKYDNYMLSIQSELPFVLKILTDKINLHDAFIKKAILNNYDKIFIMYLIGGDNQVGYFFLNIKYFNISKVNSTNIKKLFYHKKIEVLYDEIERLSENLFSHRLIFDQEGEIEIIFKNIEITISNADSSDYVLSNCIFHEK